MSVVATMMILAAAKCTPATPCPTRAELVAAIKAADDELAWRLNVAANAESDTLVFIRVLPVRRLRNVRCRPGEPGRATCSYVEVRRDGPRSRVANLTRGNDGWSFDEESIDPDREHQPEEP